jgi:acetylglutamate synthase
MVSPINGDTSIRTSTERSGETAKNSRGEQATSSSSLPLEQKSAKPSGSTVEVDDARQLFDLENQASRISGMETTTPEEARSLLDQVLEHIRNSPEEALASQGSRATSTLANLLQTNPSVV